MLKQEKFSSVSIVWVNPEFRVADTGCSGRPFISSSLFVVTGQVYH